MTARSTGATEASGEFQPPSAVLTGPTFSPAFGLRAGCGCFSRPADPPVTGRAYTMTQLTRRGRILPTGQASSQRTRKQPARRGLPQPTRRSSLRVERLEDRITPSVLGVFELD